MTNWFVVWVLTGKEREVYERLQAIRPVVKPLLPIGRIAYRREGRWEFIDEVMIPGYVFINCAMDATVYHRIREIPHVIGWLGSDSMWPTVVTEQDMLPIIEISAGCDPASHLQNVTIDKRKKRGRGTVTLCGQEKTVVFSPGTETPQDEPEPPDDTPEA